MIVPAQGATISFSIFIASRTKITSPAFTLSPTFLLTARIAPGMGAVTFVPPAVGAATGAAGAAATGAAGATGAATGAASLTFVITASVFSTSTS